IRGHLLGNGIGLQAGAHRAMDLIRDSDDAWSVDGKTYPYCIGWSKDHSQLGIEAKAPGSILLRIGIGLEVVVGIARGVDLTLGLLPGIAEDRDTDATPDVPFACHACGKVQRYLRDAARGAQIILLLQRPGLLRLRDHLQLSIDGSRIDE